MSRQPVNAVQVTRPWTWGSGTPLSQLFALPKSWYVATVMSRGLFRRHPRWTLGLLTYVVCWWFTGSWVLGAVLLVALGCLGLTAWIGWRRRCGAAPANLQDLRVEDKRRRAIKRQWPKACDSAGLTCKPAFGGAPPRFHRGLKADSDGSFVAVIDPTTTGVTVDDLAKHARRLAAVIGCKNVYVQERDDGKTEVSLFFTDALGRHLPLADLPFAPAGLVAYGIRADGSAATIDPRLSVIWGGLTGRGKSVASWIALADMLRQGMHVRLYISDGKRTELARFRKYVGQVNGTLDVRAYENTEAGTAAMLKRAVGALEKRQEWMAERDLTSLDASEENPAVIVWVDELLTLAEILAKGASSVLSLFAFTARAAHMSVWAAAQAGQVDALGRFRTFVPQRVCFGTDSTEATDAILGSQASAKGADCHRGLKPGRGWSKNEHGELLPFKAAFILPEEQDDIARGIVPAHVPCPAQGEETQLYRHYDAIGRLLYVGITNHYVRRSDQHADDKDWWKDIANTKVQKWANRTLALEAERIAIETEKPLHNVQHSTRADRFRRPRRRREPTPVEMAEAATLDFADARQRAAKKAKAAA